jgi:hypothetical protein
MAARSTAAASAAAATVMLPSSSSAFVNSAGLKLRTLPRAAGRVNRPARAYKRCVLLALLAAVRFASLGSRVCDAGWGNACEMFSM